MYCSCPYQVVTVDTTNKFIGRGTAVEPPPVSGTLLGSRGTSMRWERRRCPSSNCHPRARASWGIQEPRRRMVVRGFIYFQNRRTFRVRLSKTRNVFCKPSVFFFASGTRISVSQIVVKGSVSVRPYVAWAWATRQANARTARPYGSTFGFRKKYL